MRLTVHPLPPVGSFADLDRDRSSFADYFGDIIRSDARIRGRVLDIGCGAVPSTTRGYFRALHECGTLDGVDPSPEAMQNTLIHDRWCATLDAAEIPPGRYDALLSFFVAEHIAEPVTFLRAAFRALKPGGVLYGCTPNRHHPFALLVLFMQATDIKSWYVRRTDHKINEYPAHYRLNTPADVARAAKVAGFVATDVYAYPCVNWDRYFPRWLRWMPHAFDRLIGIHTHRCAQQIMFKLEKPAVGPDPSDARAAASVPG